MDITPLAARLEKEKIEYSVNSPMSSYTTFKIGGPADIVITPLGAEELKTAIILCREEKTPYMLIGRGSNLLVSDRGISGAVIHICKGFDEIISVGDNRVVCGAGASLSALCMFCLENSLSGLEFAYGIPGSVGGAVFMNAGAYGGEMRDVITTVEYMLPDGTTGVIAGDELAFGYRKSAFTGSDMIILSATFELRQDATEEIRARMDDYIGRRKAKQPLQYPSAGSTFKRPEGHFAGALIEGCNLKGYKVGGAAVSEKHAGFVINTGDATCDDVITLMSHIVKTVKEQCDVTLEPEIIKTGRP